MPAKAERAIKARGGAKKWRMKKTNGLMRCAITKKSGPRGGKTVCYRVRKKRKS